MFLDAGFCEATAGIWQVVGKIITYFKIGVPCILIILGFLTLGKALLAADDKEAKKAWSELGKKAILAVVIFFIPTLVDGVFKGLSVTKDSWQDATVCTACINHPNGSTCTSKVEASIE